jgi:hypothetical protein
MTHSGRSVRAAATRANAVDRGQRAVDVLAKTLVAGREGEALLLETHRRRADRDAALVLDHHLIRPHSIRGSICCSKKWKCLATFLVSFKKPNVPDIEPYK